MLPHFKRLVKKRKVFHHCRGILFMNPYFALLWCTISPEIPKHQNASPLNVHPYGKHLRAHYIQLKNQLQLSGITPSINRTEKLYHRMSEIRPLPLLGRPSRYQLKTLFKVNQICTTSITFSIPKNCGFFFCNGP